MRRRLQRVSGDEVVVLQEVPTELWREEHHRREQEQEHSHAKDVVHGVVGMERHAVQRIAIGILGRIGSLDLDTVRVVRAHIVQRQ